MVTLLTYHDVVAITGISRSHIHKKIVKGTFPQPVMVGLRGVRFRDSDIDAWIEALRVGEPPEKLP